jgi:hypothetical protein
MRNSDPPPDIGERPIVWIVDSEQWPRANLRAELIERGYDAVGHIALSPVLAALRGTCEAIPRALVLELRNQEVTRTDLQTLAATGIPVIILGGAVELQQPGIGELQWAAVMRRPVTLGEIADTVQQITGERKPTSRPPQN